MRFIFLDLLFGFRAGAAFAGACFFGGLFFRFQGGKFSADGGETFLIAFGIFIAAEKAFTCFAGCFFICDAVA